ncbi:energy transducer TonB [Crocinitomix algicola]|uniref:energy transducer TonB n=1 Tax=Crocinitomix algicola TaxID=1740263 RepID=UPI000871F26D|nr:energy transducer TonB [Crocinitomix algicola]
MRRELEEMERIDLYLSGKLSEMEGREFERKIKLDSDFNQKVMFQQLFQEGLNAYGLKQDAQLAYRKYRFRKLFLRGLFIAFAMTSIFFLYFNLNKETSLVQFVSSQRKLKLETCVSDKAIEDSFIEELEETDTALVIIGSDSTISSQEFYLEENNNSDELEKRSIDNDSEINETQINVEPTYPGGFSALSNFINQNINYPKEALINGNQGIVYVRFTIDIEGNIKNTRVEKGVSKSIDKEALRVVGLMPKWIPAMVNGQPKPAYYTLPINFSFE